MLQPTTATGVNSGVPTSAFTPGVNGSTSIEKPAKEIVVPLNIIFPALALILAIAALGLNYFVDPRGRGLNAYDFSTPKAAIESEARISINHDLRAMMEKEELLHGAKRKERLKTLEIRGDAEWRGKLLLFVTFTENGVRKHQIFGMEKLARTGTWFPVYAGKDSEMKVQNPGLYQRIETWENKGELR
jgi:hypothetical protein